MNSPAQFGNSAAILRVLTTRRSRGFGTSAFHSIRPGSLRSSALKTRRKDEFWLGGPLGGRASSSPRFVKTASCLSTRALDVEGTFRLHGTMETSPAEGEQRSTVYTALMLPPTSP